MKPSAIRTLMFAGVAAVLTAIPAAASVTVSGTDSTPARATASRVAAERASGLGDPTGPSGRLRRTGSLRGKRMPAHQASVKVAGAIAKQAGGKRRCNGEPEPGRNERRDCHRAARIITIEFGEIVG